MYYLYYPRIISIPARAVVKPVFSYFTDEEIKQLRDEGNEDLAKMLEDANALMRKCEEGA